MRIRPSYGISTQYASLSRPGEWGTGEQGEVIGEGIRGLSWLGVPRPRT